MQGRLAYGTETPLDQRPHTPLLASPDMYGCDTFYVAQACLYETSTPADVLPGTVERGCLGCLVDGYDHNCGYVGLAGLFGSRSSRRRR